MYRPPTRSNIMACQITPFVITISDLHLQSHLPITSLHKCHFSHSCLALDYCRRWMFCLW